MTKYLEKLSKPRTILHIVGVFGIMFIGNFISSIPFDIMTRIINFPYGWINHALRVMACIGVTYLLFNLYTNKFLHSNMQYFRSGKLNIKFIDFVLAVILPSIVIIVFIFIGKLSYNSNLKSNVVITTVLSAIFPALNAGILEEIVFRGYIMKLIEVKWNKHIAIILPSFIFSLLHIPSMQQFSFIGLILLIFSGTLVGIMFSLITYKNNSIWGSALTHVIWNMTIISNIVSFGQEVNNKAIFSIVYSFNTPLLSGSDFGIEASIVAITGYILISLITIFLIKKETKNDASPCNGSSRSYSYNGGIYIK